MRCAAPASSKRPSWPRTNGKQACAPISTTAIPLAMPSRRRRGSALGSMARRWPPAWGSRPSSRCAPGCSSQPTPRAFVRWWPRPASRFVRQRWRETGGTSSCRTTKKPPVAGRGSSCSKGLGGQNRWRSRLPWSTKPSTLQRSNSCSLRTTKVYSAVRPSFLCSAVSALLTPMAFAPQGLYHPDHEHDACGVGFVANIKGKKSHTIVEQGLTVLRNLTHRGAVGWDPKLSDGAGILIQIPDRFVREEMAKQGVKLPPAGQYGVGMVFLPRDPASRIACEYEIERAIKDEGQHLLGWRDVPVDNSDLADPAKKIEPVIRQVFIGRGRRLTVTDALERKLYIIRKSSGHAIQALKLKHGKEFYVPSMSARTVCYKGMLLANQVGEYYLDLKDARVESAIAMVHQRFSTNTFPSWDLAHPFRLICHNGEINTLRGNVNWIRARQGAISSPILGKDLDKV